MSKFGFTDLLEKIWRFKPSFAWKLLQVTNNTVINDREFMELYWGQIKSARMIQSFRGAFNIWTYVKKTLPLGGALAECGVYTGGSAKLIAGAKGDAPLHLFDTFSGIPCVNKSFDIIRKGNFSAPVEIVKAHLKEFTNIYFHVGIFPDTARRDLSADIKFSFVHLDMDVYESTIEGLRYFFPRLLPGAALICHDYSSIACPGVRKAYDEYFKGTNQPVIPIWDNQCIVIKM